jgi:photosynthetic reaction center cytochrome c subunit
MKSLIFLRRLALYAAGLSAVSLLTACERPFQDSVAARLPWYRHGAGVQPALVGGHDRSQPSACRFASRLAKVPKAGQTYKNVKVLGDLSVAQFNRLMASMATWVAPNDGGCVLLPQPS